MSLATRRAEGGCHCVLCLCGDSCACLTAWLLFMAGARAGRGKGDRRGYSPGDAFPPAAYQDDGTQFWKAFCQRRCTKVTSGTRRFEMKIVPPGHSCPPGWLRLLGHVWFYSGQGQLRECVDSAPGGGTPDCAHAVEETLVGRPCTLSINGETARAPGN